MQFLNPQALRFEAIVHLDRGTSSVFRRATDDTWLSFGKQASGAFSALTSYLPLGIFHVLGGWDHLAFVLLILHLTSGFRPVVLTLTGFTLGHSITLMAAALGTVQLNPQFVEVAIALSLVVLAAEILRGENDTVSRRHPAAMAAAFGLIHGLGFAGALSEIGLPPGATIPALLGFNLGVEVGQFVVAGLAVTVALLITRIKPSVAPAYQQVTAWSFGAIGTIAAVGRLLGA